MIYTPFRCLCQSAKDLFWSSLWLCTSDKRPVSPYRVKWVNICRSTKTLNKCLYLQYYPLLKYCTRLFIYFLLNWSAYYISWLLEDQCYPHASPVLQIDPGGEFNTCSGFPGCQDMNCSRHANCASRNQLVKTSSDRGLRWWSTFRLKHSPKAITHSDFSHGSISVV